MQRNQQHHSRSTQPLIDRHLFTSRNGEGDGLCITVEQIHIARSTSERARSRNPVADVLHSVGCIACNESTSRLVIETKRRNSIVLAMKDPRLTIRSCRRQSAKPSAQI